MRAVHRVWQTRDAVAKYGVGPDPLRNNLPSSPALSLAWRDHCTELRVQASSWQTRKCSTLCELIKLEWNGKFYIDL